MKETAKDYLFRSLKWLGGVFAVTVGILVGADQLVELGWPLEWYVIAFLSVGIFMLVTLLTYFYRQMRKFETKIAEATRGRPKPRLEKMLAREFRLKDTSELEVARLPLEKGQKIKVSMKTSDQTLLTIMTTGFPRKKLQAARVIGTFIQVFTIPTNGDWVFLLKDDRGFFWRIRYIESPKPISGQIQVFEVH